jgi:hypothetical protein
MYIFMSNFGQDRHSPWAHNANISLSAQWNSLGILCTMTDITDLTQAMKKSLTFRMWDFLHKILFSSLDEITFCSKIPHKDPLHSQTHWQHRYLKTPWRSSTSHSGIM